MGGRGYAVEDAKDTKLTWDRTDCGQDHHGGGSGPRRQDQLRGVHEDGREHRCVYEHDFGYVALPSPETTLNVLRQQQLTNHLRRPILDSVITAIPAGRNLPGVLSETLVGCWENRVHRQQFTRKRTRTQHLHSDSVHPSSVMFVRARNITGI